MGFTTIVDMRGNATWNSVKPILKVLQEYFAAHIHTAHIIKPNNFFQKTRTSLGSQKFKFETNLISTDALLKVLDPSQLTKDLDGTLLYDNSIWIELRCVSCIKARSSIEYPHLNRVRSKIVFSLIESQILIEL